MQHLPFDREPSVATVYETFERLAALQIMTQEQIAEVDVSKIAGFLASPPGLLLQRADWIRREMPFSYGMAANEAYPKLTPFVSELYNETRFGTMEATEMLEQESVLLQGIVDCLFYVDGKQILLDYKSDKVLAHRGGIPALTEMYRFQLELYASAVEQITGVPVDEKWLYFFDSGDAVSL